MRSWWWFRKWLALLVLFVMTGGRYHRRKKMMGRGPDGGCGTDERPCRPVTRVSVSKSVEVARTASSKQLGALQVDIFSQARKALCERSPFDVPEDGPASGPSCSSTVCTLPTALASLLKQSDSRKRHKKSHSNNGKKSSRVSERSKGGNIWVETEDYFRELDSPDIDALAELHSSLRSSVTGKCLLIPHNRNEETDKTEEAPTVENADNNVVGSASCVNAGTSSDGNVSGNVIGDENGNMVVTREKAKHGSEQYMQIDCVGAQSNGAKPCAQRQSVLSVSDFCNRIEWLLGCRNKVLLTSERPLKKHKVVGTDAGLEKIFVCSPCAGNASLCDFCCKGENGSDSAQLIVCSSCKVAVHRSCYGVQGHVDESWLCSWCKQKTDGNSLVKQHCVLCPKQGGALKPVASENGGSTVEFAHLFCAQWLPEVYVEDLLRMEPIMNVTGITESGRKSVCNVCKVKCGTCVRCSHGSCRTAFHPMCAREARQKMEVWGKYGHDNVELWAFCTKHSDVSDSKNASLLGEPSIAASNDFADPDHSPTVVSTDKQQKFNICCSGYEASVNAVTPENNPNNFGNVEFREAGSLDSRFNSALLTEFGNGDELNSIESSARNNNADASPSDSLNLGAILEKLIDQGKVSVKDVALDIGISPDSLVSSLAEDSLDHDLQCKIVKWLRNNSCLGILHKDLKVRLKSTILSKGEMRIRNHSDAVPVPISDVADPVAVTSLPPRRRTKSNIRILRDDKAVCVAEEILNENGIVIDDIEADHLVSEEQEKSSQLSISDATQKEEDEFQDSLASCLPQSDGNSHNPLDGFISKGVESACTVIQKQSGSINEGLGRVYSDLNSVLPDIPKLMAFTGYYLHPSVHQKVLQMQNGMLLKNEINWLKGFREGNTCGPEVSSNTSICCHHLNKQSICSEMTFNSNGVNLERLHKAENLGVLELSPADEVEGEIIYFQHRLLGNAVAIKHFSDNLISNVARSLPLEIDVARGLRWDAVLANQYLSDLREAKKQGRKERRHKEAQAVLAAATAAVANSSRMSSFRKDGFDESAQQERCGILNGRTDISSQMTSRTKETLSRLALPRSSSEKYSDFSIYVSDCSKEHPRSCDICRRSETILNPVLVCSSCKVAVHLDCYRSVSGSAGPWYCELCEELSSSNVSRALPTNVWEKPLAECSLCGGFTGAFRKSADGQWVHAFCAEWIFESTFRRGQVNPVEGMETVAKGIDICCICHRNHGICIKCSYGHCQTTFHPSCARSVGFYMNVKSLCGKLQHKAYCEKHGLEQKAKAESQKHGVEELRSIKQVRVELERLRLLCERIVRREKIKRDLVLCSHGILGYKRDQVARTVLFRNPFFQPFQPDVSSESATTSLKGNTDDYKSCSDAMQRSDDVTVDSTLSVKQRSKVSMMMDHDRKTADSFTSQNLLSRKPTERVTFGGKQIPQRALLASQNVLDNGEWSSKSRKHFETFEKELVMTSDQASMKNQQLPKGYFYIPVDCLPKEQQLIDEDVCSGKPLVRDG